MTITKAAVRECTPTTPSPGQDAQSFDRTTPGVGAGAPPPPRPKIYRRIYGSVELDPLKTSLQVKTIADEIIQHLQSLVGARVTLTLEIEAHLPDGAPEHVIRTVTENARTLKFNEAEFEEN